MRLFKDLQKISLAVQFTLLYLALTWMAFYAVYMEEKGLSSTQIGNVFGAFQATLLVVVPFWGILSDKYGNKRMFVLATLGSGILMLILPKFISFSVLIVFIACVSFFIHPLGSLMDSLSISYCKKRKKASYGEFRMYGAVGWAIGSFILGWLVDKKSIDIIFPYCMIFYGLLFVFALLYPAKDVKVNEDERMKLRDLKILVSNPLLMVFLLLTFLYGIATTPMNYFIALYFSEIGGTNSTLGTALMVQALSEIPFFFLGTLLIKKIGLPKAVYLALFFGFLRMLLYGFTSNPTIAVLIGLMQGFSFSVFIVAAAEFVHGIVPQKLRATGQALIWAFHFGAGYSIGNIWIGFMREKINMQGVMFVEAGFTLLIFVGFALFFVLMKKSATNAPIKNE